MPSNPIRMARRRHKPATLAQQATAAEGNPDWSGTLERIVSSVVAINIDEVRAFDTEWNATAQATGFVVDAERGLILTNRHVVTPGPVTAEATFLNREEVQLYPVYRDPVHDFGLYHYDPSKLHFIKPKALPLFPEGAKVGTEIRVIGNNAVSSCRFSPAPWRGWTVMRPSMAPTSTTTSIPFICRPRRAPPGAPPAHRWSTSAGA